MIAEVKNLTFTYGKQPPVFENFNLKIQRGETVSIIGPSGCGKTTLLHLMAGLLRPKSGKIVIAGSPVFRPRPQTGLVFQDHGLLPWATVLDNALLGFRIRSFYGPDGRHALEESRTDKDEAMRRVNRWLIKLGIDSLINKYPAQLSRGQRQRTAIARTLALEPDILLMDEPFSALDAAIRENLYDLVMKIHRESALTVIIVTHNIDEAIQMGKKILVLRGSSNRQSHYIENHIAGLSDYQNRPEFKILRKELRVLLNE